MKNEQITSRVHLFKLLSEVKAFSFGEKKLPVNLLTPPHKKLNINNLIVWLYPVRF